MAHFMLVFNVQLLLSHGMMAVCYLHTLESVCLKDVWVLSVEACAG